MFFTYFCGFSFCHVTFDFRDVCALDLFFSEGYVGLVLIKAFARLVLCLTQPKHGFNIVSFENNYCFWTPKWGEKSVPETSTLSKVLPRNGCGMGACYFTLWAPSPLHCRPYLCLPCLHPLTSSIHYQSASVDPREPLPRPSPVGHC